MVVLDTSIIIEHLRLSKDRESSLINIIQKCPNESLAISSITIQELYEGQSTRDDRKERLLIETINPLILLPYTKEIAQLAGIIARDLNEPIEIADAAIAATTILNKAKLATLNTKHFRNISDLIFLNF